MAEQSTSDLKDGAGGAGSGGAGAVTPPARRAAGSPGGGSLNLSAFDGFKFLVEVDDGNGGRLQLQASPRVGKVVRGRWELAKLGERIVDDRLKNVPQVIPGIVIIVDFAARKIAFTDPLSWKSNAALLKELQKVMKEFSGVDQGPEKELSYAPLTADQMKTWLYWLRRHLDARQLKVHRGTVPEMSEIMRLPGRALMQPHDKNPKVMVQQSEVPYMAPFQSGEENSHLGVDYEQEMAMMFGGAET